MQRDKTISHYHTDPKIINQPGIGTYKPGQLMYLDVDGIYKLAVAWSHQESQVAGMVWEIFGNDKISLRVEPTPVFYEHPLGPEWFSKDIEGRVILTPPLEDKIPGEFGDRLWLSDKYPGDMQLEEPNPFKTIIGYKTKDGLIFRPERLFCCPDEVYEPISSSSAFLSSSSSSVIFSSSSSSIFSSSSSSITTGAKCRFTYTAQCSYGDWSITNAVWEGCVENCTGDVGWQGTGCTRTFSYCGEDCQNILVMLSGNVSTSGQPISGTNINITSSYPVNLNYNIVTDSFGNYESSVPIIVDVSASYIVVASLSGYTFTPSATNIIYEGFPMVANFSGSFIPPLTGMSIISGNISTSGQALSGVNLNISTLSYLISSNYNTLSDMSGNYSMSVVVAATGSFVIIPSLSGYTFAPSSSNVFFIGYPMVANFSGNINGLPDAPGFNVNGSDGLDGNYYLSGYGAWTFGYFGIDPSYTSYGIYTNGTYDIFYFADYGLWLLGDAQAYDGNEPYYGYEFSGSTTPPESTWYAPSGYYPTITAI